MDLSALYDKISWAARTEGAVFFVGAGTSHDYPSCLPLGSEIKDGVMHSLLEDGSGLLRSYYRDVMGSRKFPSVSQKLDRLPLEMLLEIVYEICGRKALDVYDILKCRVPNFYHHFLAKLAKLGYLKAIFTTNLDELIELTMRNEGISLHVYATTEEFEKCLESGTIFPIFKLHGSIALKDDLVVTLQQVGRGLPKLKAQILNNYLRQHCFIFLGYSGRDRFDILPALQRADPYQIIWIDHAEGVKDPEIHNKSEIVSKLGQSPVLDLLGNLGSDEVFLARYDTREFVRGLAKELGITLGMEIKPCREEKLEDYFEDWSKRMEKWHRFLIVGHTLRHVAEFDESIKIYSLMKKFGKNLRSLRIIAEADNCIGFAYWKKGDFHNAIKFLRKALHRFAKLNDAFKVSWALNNIGLVHWYGGKLLEALKWYERAVPFKREIYARAEGKSNRFRAGVSLSGIYNDIGLVYWDLGELEVALNYYRRALAIKRKISDVWGQSVVLSNMGLVYFDKGQFKRAKRYYDKAFEIRDAIGDEWQKAISYYCFAELNLHQGHLDEALSFAIKSLKIRENINDARGISLVNLLLGYVFYEKRSFEKAIRYFDSVKDSDFHDVKIAALRGMAGILREQGYFKESKELLIKSLRLSRTRKFKKEEAKTSKELGVLYLRMGSIRKARSVLKRAESIFNEIGNKKEIKKINKLLHQAKRDSQVRRCHESKYISTST